MLRRNYQKGGEPEDVRSRVAHPSPALIPAQLVSGSLFNEPGQAAQTSRAADELSPRIAGLAGSQVESWPISDPFGQPW